MHSLRHFGIACLATASLSVTSATSAQAFPILNNGGFETGTLSGWSTSGLGTGGTCPTSLGDWEVSASSSATGCLFPGDPIEGTYAAYNMLDGTAGTHYQLWQNFIMPLTPTGGTLSWQDSIVSDYSGTPRQFLVRLLSFNGLQPYGTIFNLAVPFSDNDASWTTRSFDITPLLLMHPAETVRLEFMVVIPETWTGPAGLGLDAVSLDLRPIPEPASMLLLGAGLLGLAIRARKH